MVSPKRPTSGDAPAGRPAPFDPAMIAACGMDCTLCSANTREKRQCAGCNGEDAGKPNYCVTCPIKFCAEPRTGATGLCFECAKYPCARLRRLDKRYRGRYGMSMLENLERIREGGLEAFMDFERERWKCPECGETICVHKPECVNCGHAWH
jgi:hypothetical protein